MAASAEQIAAVADRLEHVLRRLHAWTDPPPPPQPFRAPFGMDAMPFEHWIQLVLLPRMREIARTGAAIVEQPRGTRGARVRRTRRPAAVDRRPS